MLQIYIQWIFRTSKTYNKEKNIRSSWKYVLKSNKMKKHSTVRKSLLFFSNTVLIYIGVVLKTDTFRNQWLSQNVVSNLLT